jgi:hypothetical protein
MVDEFERWTEEVDKFDQIRKDAADSLEKSINKQSDDRIAKLKQIKNEPFMAQVGRKIIGGVKGAIKGFSGKEGIKEGTWALPDTDDEIRDLKDLMSKPLKVGVDAVEATSALYDLVGDDKLFDILGNLAEKNPEANIWDEPEVQKRFEELGMVDAIEGHNQRNPESIAQTTVRPEVQPTESIETVTNEDLAMLKWLSGIQK